MQRSSNQAPKQDKPPNTPDTWNIPPPSPLSRIAKTSGEESGPCQGVNNRDLRFYGTVVSFGFLLDGMGVNIGPISPLETLVSCFWWRSCPFSMCDPNEHHRRK
jgi:hypothetical protein